MFTVTTLLFRRPPIIIRDQPRLRRAFLSGVPLHQVIPFALRFKNQVGYFEHSPMPARTFNAEFRQSQYNSAFVLMEYFGYLRRDADVINSG